MAEIDLMRTDVLDRACAVLWEEIRELLRRENELTGSEALRIERRALRARVNALRGLSARYREVQRREGRAGVTHSA